MKTLDYSKLEKEIVKWLTDYSKKAGMEGYVIGVSGGVDSAVVSTLAAKTGLKLYTLQMPIRQKQDEVSRAASHINWLMREFKNVYTIKCDLTNPFDWFLTEVEQLEDEEKQNLAEANTRARLRMITLYYHASIKNCLVLGTGNRVEDYGCGFFSKFGDGGIDISPTGDLMKSEVRKLGEFMGVSDEIIKAKPTDGLWDDGRGDEDIIGATYDELEWAMEYIEDNPIHFAYSPEDLNLLSKRQQEVLFIYKTRHFANKHKMEMPPIFDTKQCREQ